MENEQGFIPLENAFASNVTRYLRGKMTEKEAEEFMNEVLEDEKKIKEFQDLRIAFGITQDLIEEYRGARRGKI